jgi:hypothetical protein
MLPTLGVEKSITRVSHPAHEFSLLQVNAALETYHNYAVLELFRRVN